VAVAAVAVAVATMAAPAVAMVVMVAPATPAAPLIELVTERHSKLLLASQGNRSSSAPLTLLKPTYDWAAICRQGLNQIDI
jgi:hypothetical protein